MRQMFEAIRKTRPKGPGGGGAREDRRKEVYVCTSEEEREEGFGRRGEGVESP